MTAIRLAVGCLAMAVIGSRIRAQEPGLETAALRWDRAATVHHLASKDGREVAWAAHRVGETGQRAAVPEVRKALARFAGAEDLEARLACLVLLDVLIRLDARVPAEELLPHVHDSLAVPALILAARCPLQNTEFFVSTMAGASEGTLVWNACGNLLAAQRAPGFAAACLAAFRPIWCVEVTDSPAYSGRVSVG